MSKQRGLKVAPPAGTKVRLTGFGSRKVKR
jgi:hypothetical protein